MKGIKDNENQGAKAGFGDEVNHSKGHENTIEHNVPDPNKSLLPLRELIEAGPNITSWIKFPEWKGFWVKVFKDVYVFTKDNEILNTPEIDVYGDRQDYIYVDLGNPENLELKINFIKMNRVRLDLLLITMESLLAKNRETSLVKTSIQLASMWLGKFVGELGAENPYPQSFDPSSPVIERRADTSADNPQIRLFNSFNDLDYTGIVKAFRSEVSHCLNLFGSFKYIPHKGNNINLYPSEMAIPKSLQEANFWLGMELNNIHVEAKRKLNEFTTSLGPNQSQEATISNSNRMDIQPGAINEEKLLFEAMESYRKYGEFTDFKNFMNQPMPKWEELSEKIQGAWKNSIRRFVK